MQSTYSWLGSPIHLILEDEVADAYNRVVDAFLSAQLKHREVHGSHWVPKTEPLLMEVDENDDTIYNKLANIITELCSLNGGLTIPDEEITSDYLIKL